MLFNLLQWQQSFKRNRQKQLHSSFSARKATLNNFTSNLSLKYQANLTLFSPLLKTDHHLQTLLPCLLVQNTGSRTLQHFTWNISDLFLQNPESSVLCRNHFLIKLCLTGGFYSAENCWTCWCCCYNMHFSATESFKHATFLRKHLGIYDKTWRHFSPFLPLVFLPCLLVWCIKHFINTIFVFTMDFPQHITFWMIQNLEWIRFSLA